MKKKILALILVVVMAATAVVGGTMAYLTDEDSDVNVMTLGNVSIEQIEQERGDDGLQEFTQNQTIAPAADVTGAKEAITVNDYDLKIRTGETYVDKIVSVTNNGKSDAYVRTIFAFPEAGDFDTTTDAAEQWFHWNGVSDTDTNPHNGWMWGADKVTEWPANAGGWDVVENVTISGRKYDIYVATNKNPLAPGESTAPSLLGFYLDTRVDCDGTNYIFTDKDGKEWNLGDISTLDVLVFSQAVQTEGFDDAWQALDAAFGDITATNHPWVNTEILVDEAYYQNLDATEAYTVNGEGKTIVGVASSVDAFQWEGNGTIPVMSTIFSSSNGSTVTVNDITFTGTMSSVMAGKYVEATYTNYNTVFNNVNIIDAEVVSFSSGISPALTVYGNMTMNNCEITGTTLSALDTDPMWPTYDMAVVNYSHATLNNCTVGSIYMWNQAEVTVASGTEVESIVIRGNMNTTKYGLKVEAGAIVDAIDLSNIDKVAKVNITIAEGATVGAFVDNGVEYATLDAWAAAQ